MQNLVLNIQCRLHNCIISHLEKHTHRKRETRQRNRKEREREREQKKEKERKQINGHQNQIDETHMVYVIFIILLFVFNT